MDVEIASHTFIKERRTLQKRVGYPNIRERNVFPQAATGAFNGGFTRLSHRRHI
jgi:hypothetical protein